MATKAATTKPATTKPAATKSSATAALLGGAGGEETTEQKATTAKAPAKGTVSKMTAAVALKIASGLQTPKDQTLEVAEAIENLTAESSIQLARDMIEKQGFDDYRLGGVLAVIQDNKYWEGHGHDTFKDFIRAEFGLEYRKALYLIQIYKPVAELSIPWASVADLGWTKLKEVAPKFTAENWKHWVSVAKERSISQLLEFIKTHDEDGKPLSQKDKTAPTEKTMKSLSFQVDEDQKNLINATLDTAQKTFGTDSKAVALERIVMAYAEGSLGQKKGKAAAIVYNEDTLIESMKAVGDWEKILTIFADLYPHIDIEAAPAEAEEEEVEVEVEQEEVEETENL